MYFLKQDYEKVTKFMVEYIKTVTLRYGEYVIFYDVVTDAVEHESKAIAVDVEPHGFIKKSPWSLIDLKFETEKDLPVYICNAVKVLRITAPHA